MARLKSAALVSLLVTLPGVGSRAQDEADTLSLLFFQSSEGGLYAIDPLHPTAAPVIIDSEAASPPVPVASTALRVRLADLDPGTGVLSNGRVERVVYNRSDGTLWQVDAARVGSAGPATVPVPRRVSSESEAAEICTISQSSGVGAEVEQVSVLYSLPGPDRSCASEDNVWRVVRLGMGDSQPPLTFPGQPRAGIVEPADFRHAGWLAEDAGSLLKVAPDLTTTWLAAVSRPPVILYGQVRTNHVFLSIDGSLYVLDLAGGTLTDTGHDSVVDPRVGEPWNLAAFIDGERLFFIAPTPASESALFTAGVDGGVELLHEPADATNFLYNLGPLFTRERVVYGYATAGNDFPSKLISLRKDGTNLVVLHDGDIRIGVEAMIEELVVLQTTDEALAPGDLTILKDDGSASPFRLEDSDVVIVPGPPTVRPSEFAAPEFVFALQGVGMLNSAAGATLLALDPRDPESALRLGQIPSDIVNFFPLAASGSFRLAQAQRADDVTAMDIFFLDSRTADSVLRITDNADESEFPLP